METGGTMPNVKNLQPQRFFYSSRILKQ